MSADIQTMEVSPICSPQLFSESVSNSNNDHTNAGQVTRYVERRTSLKSKTLSTPTVNEYEINLQNKLVALNNVDI